MSYLVEALPNEIKTHIYGYCQKFGGLAIYNFSLTSQSANKIAYKDVKEMLELFEKLKGLQKRCIFNTKISWFDPNSCFKEYFYKCKINDNGLYLCPMYYGGILQRIDTDYLVPCCSDGFGIEVKYGELKQTCNRDGSFRQYFIPGSYTYTFPINELKFYPQDKADYQIMKFEFVIQLLNKKFSQENEN